MRKRKKGPRKSKKALDKFGRKSRRGRKGVHRPEVRNRGDHYRTLLPPHWRVVGKALLRAKTEEDVNRAFGKAPEYVKREFTPSLAPLILRVLREPTFPKQYRKAQIRFLADSLAARGVVSPRRSRDICWEERGKPTHYIVRQDFYIQCTCGYKGPALHGACPKCGTETVQLPPPTILRGTALN